MKAVCSLALLALLAGCGSGSTVSVPDGKGGTLDVTTKENGDRSEVTMTGKDGQTINMSSNTKNANFPAFAPQYPGSTVVSTSSIKTGETGLMTVEMDTPASPDAVVAFYKTSATSAGMPINMTGNFDGAGSLQAGDVNNKSTPALTVSAAPENGKTRITLIITNAK